MNLINIWPVVSNHFDSLNEDSPSPFTDKLLLVGMPAMVSFLSLQYPVSTSLAKTTITALAILFGFSFNAVILFAGTDYSDKKPKEQKSIELTEGNTHYSLVIGFSALVFAFLVFAISKPEPSSSNWLLVIFSYILYFFLLHYFLTLMMILRRLSILISGDLLSADK